MERVTLLIESTGQRLSALLNPEGLLLRRSAGVRTRSSIGGAITGTALADDPLLFTGGGATELELDLLFDVTMSGSTIETDDVRALTQPFFALAENLADAEGGRPPLLRFIWGKGWNFPGVIAAVAERLEYFTDLGVARRSWLRMRLLRVTDEPPVMPPEPALVHRLEEAEQTGTLPPIAGDVDLHPVLSAGTGEGDSTQSERLDQIATRYYGHPALWRVLALYNDLPDPLTLDPSLVLRVPPLGLVEEAL